MKTISSLAFFLSVLLSVVFFSCILEKEPDFPTDITNVVPYTFQDTRLTRVTQDGINAWALLNTDGTLNITQHGWVWSEHPNPTFQDNMNTLGALSKDSFETLITGLLPGKLYYIRPYIITGSGELFGQEKTIKFISTTFKNVFGGQETEYGASVCQTTDGGFISLGNVHHDNGDFDMYLIKTDADGYQQWQKTIGSTEKSEYGESIQQTIDGGFILFGSIDSMSYTKMYLVKTDASGYVLWEKVIKEGGENSNYGYCAQQTTDGGFILSGFHYSNDTSTFLRMYLVKTNADGEIEWEKTFGPTLSIYEESVQQTADSGFILLGTIVDENTFDKEDMYLVKTNAAGDVQWESRISKAGEQYGQSVELTDDGYILLGYRNDLGSNDMYLVKTNLSGEVEWDKTFDRGGSEFGRFVEQTEDGGFILLGVSGNTGINEYDLFLVKTTAYGIVEWERVIGGKGSQWGSCVRQTSEGVFILMGTNWVTGNGDMYLLKTDEYGKVY